jgi:signal transduction histidine kinase/ligand-binding sensor domain-containing protein/DNA-binding response OmpR family regulator
MNLLRFAFLIIFLLGSLIPLKVIGQDIRFKHLTTNDGLSQNAILSMVQDKDGYLWFGTKDGLNKYDGYQFTVFQNEPGNATSISSNYITELFTDKSGKIWIGTDHGIVNCYSNATNTFQRIALPMDQSQSKNNREISSITEDVSGAIWIGTNGNGVFKIPLQNDHAVLSGIKSYNLSVHKSQKDANRVSALHADGQGIVWIGSEKGLFRMDTQNETIRDFPINIKHPKAPGDTNDFLIASIAQADKNHLWLGTISGLVYFNTNTFSHQAYLHELSVFRYGWGQINQIAPDKKGYLWLATPDELMRFDTKSKTYQSLKNDPLQAETISYNNVHSVCVDRTGIVWVGTTGMGIDYYDPKVNQFSLVNRKAESNSRISGFSIRSILEQDDRYVWIGSNVLYRWDRKTDELKSYETTSLRPNDFGNTGVWSMIKSSDNKLWFATIEGLFQYDPVTEKSKQYLYDPNNKNGLPEKELSCVFEDSKGTIWLVTANCLSKLMDVEKGLFEHYPYRSNLGTHLMNRSVLYEGENNNLYIGTKGGLLVFNTKKRTYHTYQNIPDNTGSLSNNSVNTICPDIDKPGRYLWIGTSGGLNLFDIQTKAFKNYTQKDGLPNNVIYGILPDSQHNLWMSTNKGLSKFNLKTKKFRNYDVADGLQSNEFNTGAFFKSDKGEFFFGGIKGMNYFFPEQIRDNPFEPPIRISGIKVYRESNSKNEGTQISTRSIHSLNEISFTHQDDMIVFDFAALDFSAPEKNKYAYKLENFNDNWIYLEDSRTATFTNLPSGTYTLLVKGANNDGVWNERGIALPIHVLPHWSATWWAFAIYTLLFLLLLYWIRNYEMKRLQLKNDLEVEHKEIDTLKVLDQLKSRFFANISHEFRTPLTLIRGNAEKLMTELPTNTYRKDVEMIDEQAKSLLKLINELLDISKLEAGKMTLNNSQQNIVLYLKNLFYSLESFASFKKIALHFISDEENIQAVFDQEKMEKIVMNLLSNALKFTPEKGEITLTVRMIESKVAICICDTGIGIPEEDLPNIFNRFYQVDNSDTRQYEGTGIGLALAKELIELHQGTIKVYRNKELSGLDGTTFLIDIPVGEITNAIHELPSETVSVNEKITNATLTIQTIDGLTSKRHVVLVVEDNVPIRTFIKNQLEATYKIVEAGNGLEGIELAKNHIPDVIISDVMMPVMDGTSMVINLREDEKTSHIPIILLTGKATLEDKLVGLETGVSAYLTKPFSVKELQLIVSNLIQHREELRKKYQNKLITTSDDVEMTSVDQKFLDKLIQHIRANIENPNLSVDQLADQMCLSASQLNRKLQALMNQAPGQLIRNIRLQKAADLIKQNAGNLAEICFQTGFNDQTYFSKAFKQQFGCSPSSYKKEQSRNFS